MQLQECNVPCTLPLLVHAIPEHSCTAATDMPMGIKGRTACAFRNTTSELCRIKLCTLSKMTFLGVYPDSPIAGQPRVMLTTIECFDTYHR